MYNNLHMDIMILLLLYQLRLYYSWLSTPPGMQRWYSSYLARATKPMLPTLGVA
jgi:hypothetical protein